MVIFGRSGGPVAVNAWLVRHAHAGSGGGTLIYFSDEKKVHVDDSFETVVAKLTDAMKR